MKNRYGIVWAPVLIMVGAVLVAGVAGYFMFQASKPDADNTNVAVVDQTTTNLNTSSNFNTNQATITNAGVNTNTSNADETYPANVAQQFSTRADLGSSYYFGVSNLDKPISTPFPIDQYHAAVTTYGILFWKKGEQRTTTFPSFGDEKIAYENGVSPDFRWYDFKRREFVTLPATSWKPGDKEFDRVFAIHASSTQPRVAIEIGEYDIASTEFEPGLIDSQPVKTRGLQYSPVTNTFLSEDPLGIYKQGVGIKTTQWYGFMWDSRAMMAAAVPGGEGCGPAPSMTVVNLRSGQVTIINDLRQTVGWGGYDFSEDQCNPRNGRSPDGKWLLLMGKTKDNRLGFRLFRLATGGTEEKVVYTKFTELYDSVKQWDLSKPYPIITTEKGAVADFNQ